MTDTAMAPNALARMIARFDALPEETRFSEMSQAFGQYVKFFGTAGVQIDDISGGRVKMSIQNQARVQNHIGTVHAAAMALLAESATGILVGLNVPDGKLPLIKSMNLRYVKRATGDMYAEAWLDEAQLAQMHSQDKGGVTVAIKVTDEKGVEPVVCEMTWAWIPDPRAGSQV